MSNADIFRLMVEENEKNETGFGDLFTSEDLRLMNSDGTLNVQIEGMERWNGFNLYKKLVKISTVRFYAALLLIYLALNAVFAIIYYMIGINGLDTMDGKVDILDAFFFSTQSFTTVGYGHISPSTISANIVASLEAFVGLLYFAVATGLVYGRFSNSSADVRFSDNILLTTLNGERLLMLRLANVSAVELSDLHAEIVMSWIENVKGQKMRRYRKLNLDLDKINLLTTSWTIVHKITDGSPCHIMNDKEKYKGLEFMIFITAFDEVFDQKVKIRTSYVESDLIHQARFVPITTYGPKTAVVNLDLLSAYEELDPVSE